MFSLFCFSSSLICLVMHLCLSEHRAFTFLYICLQVLLFFVFNLRSAIKYIQFFYQLFCETSEDILMLVEDISSSRFLNLDFWAEYPLRSCMLKIVYIQTIFEGYLLGCVNLQLILQSSKFLENIALLFVVLLCILL